MSGAGGVRGNLLVGSVATEVEVATEDVCVVLCIVENDAVVLAVFSEVPENDNIQMDCAYGHKNKHQQKMLFIIQL